MKAINDNIRNFNFDKFSFEDVKDFFNTKDLSIMGHKAPITHIYRCRKNNIFNELFYFEKDISYRPDLKNIKSFGRSNFPNSSKFYGAIPTKEIDEGYLISILETSPNYRNDLEGIEFYTVGQFQTKKEYNLVTIIPDPANAKLSEINEYLIEIFNSYKSQKKITIDQIEFHELIGKEFSKKVKPKNENEYALSATFSEALLQNQNIDGIIYPSVQSHYKGVNIVLNPKNADETLQLNDIKFGAFYKIGNIATFNPHLTADLKKGYPFRWENDVRAKNMSQIIDFFQCNGISNTDIIETFFEQMKNK